MKLPLAVFSIAILVTVAAATVHAAGLDEAYGKPTSEKSWGALLADFVGYSGFTKSYALVVGISEYTGDYGSLPTSKDPGRMRDFLIDEAGFDYVHVLTNEKATSERIRELMVDFFPEEVDQNDRFLFYWSGHGDQRPNAVGGQEGYLPLTDSAKGRFSSMISMGDIQRWDELLRSRQALFLLDACFSGLAGNVPQSSQRDLKIEHLSQPAHHLVTAGTGEEKTIAGDRWDGSIFTDSFIRAVRGEADAESSFPRDGVVSLNELIEYVNTRVDSQRRASGWDKTITPSIRDLRGSPGQFFFLTNEQKIAKIEETGAKHQGEFAHGLPVAIMGTKKGEIPPVKQETENAKALAVQDLLGSWMFTMTSQNWDPHVVRFFPDGLVSGGNSGGMWKLTGKNLTFDINGFSYWTGVLHGARSMIGQVNTNEGRASGWSAEKMY